MKNKENSETPKSHTNVEKHLKHATRPLPAYAVVFRVLEVVELLVPKSVAVRK